MNFAFDDFELDAERLELRCAGRLVNVNPMALMVLSCLVRQAGQLVSKEELVAQVWEGRAITDAAITVTTARLRKTLKRHGGGHEFFESVYGRGYRFLWPVTVRQGGSAAPAPLVDAGSTQPPFVGRERMLHRLRQSLEQARAGRGCMCALIGEAGIGKTRVVEELERELRGPSMLVSWGGCQELGDTPPLAPWRRALRPALARLDPGELEASLGGLAVDLLSSMRTVSHHGERTAAVGGRLEPAQRLSRVQLAEAIARAAALAAERGPLVIVFDDLHRADSATLELLAQMIDGLGRTRLLIIATLRPPPFGPSGPAGAHLDYAVGHRNCERVVLEPLGRDEVMRYVGAVLQDGDGSLGRAVFDKSEGNPFFMKELSLQLSDMEVPAVDALQVPEAALELMRQRIARLDAQSRSVLSTAAVVGRMFELPTLQSVTGSDAATLMENLDAARGAEVLVMAPDSMTAFAFSHELIRVALYDGLAPGLRRRIHLRTAQALEQRLAGGESIEAGELAYHFHRALPEGDPRKAVHHCRAAASAASRVFANAEVARSMRRGLEALALVGRPSVRLRMSMLQAIAMHTRTTDPAEFGRVMDELIRLASEHEDGPSLVMAGAILNPSMGLKPEPRAAEVHERALAVLPGELDPLRAIALAGSAACAPTCYDAGAVQERLDEAVALAAAAGSDRVDHGVLPCRLYLRGGPAHDAEERAVRQELEALLRSGRRRMPLVPAELAYSRAITAWQRAQLTASVDAIERAESSCREMDQREGLWHAERARVLQRLHSAADSDVLGPLASLHSRATAQSLVRTEPFCAFDRAVVLPELGCPAVLDESLRRGLTFDPTEPPSIWSMKVRALSAAGYLDAANAALRAVPARALAKLPCDRDYLGTLAHLARAALQLGARDYVAELHALLEPYAERICVHVSFYPEGSGAHLLGVLSAELGERSRAIELLQQGVAADEAAGLTQRAAEARRQLFRCRAGA